MKYNLKPCPFCGGPAEMVERSFTSILGLVKAYSIHCESCYVSTSEIDESDDIKDKPIQNHLIKIWNTRKK
jgi:Lar family restriction alleviation protein